MENAGVPGENSSEALERLHGVLRTAPDHLVVLYGMNDALNHSQGKLIDIPAYRGNLVRIVHRARAAGVSSVALVGIHPINAEYVRERHPAHPERHRLQEHLAAYDAAVRKAAEETGAIFVDWRARFLSDSPGNTTEEAVSNDNHVLIRCAANCGARDGVHLTVDGSRRLAAEVARVLGSRICEADRVVCLGDSLTFGASDQPGSTALTSSYPAVLGELFHGAINPQTA